MFEGWDKIKIVWSKGEYPEYNLSDKIGILEEYDQDNSHHSFTLGEHLIKCSDYITDNGGDANLVISGLLHDIGKPEVRSFYNVKGEPTSEAHYYNHNNTSAYEAVFYLKSMGYDDYDIVDISYDFLLFLLNACLYLCAKWTFLLCLYILIIVYFRFH